MDEAGVLLGQPVTTLADMEAAGGELVARYHTAFLLKGGHLRGEPRAIDLLCMLDGARHRFAAPFVPDVATHGTGCTTSAAIASYIALGLPLPEAVERTKVYVTKAVRKFFRWESGQVRTDALNHGQA
jgi:hydroxymethylpyrimidine/phosphomethylpyrimidine kinase